MKSRVVPVGILAAVLLGVVTAQAGTAAGFPSLSPVPKTGALKNDPKATKFWFIAAGDNRPASESLPQPDVLSQIFDDAQKFKPVFFLWSGDTIYGHENHRKKLEAQYKEFFGKAEHANVPVFNAPGNHEMDSVQKIGNEKIETPDSKLQALYLEFMKFPAGAPAYGAFDYGNSRFIALDTEEVAPPTPTPTATPTGTPTATPGATATATATATPAKKLKLDPGFVSPQQIDLLTQDLEANKSKAHIFVFMHHPIMPAKSSSGLEPAIATALQTLFKKYPNVSYVIAAHEHLYYNATGTTLAPVDRQDPSSQGPSYLVSGGAGAPLDTCPASACSNCGSFNHYLAFEVDGDTVKVQLVQIPSNSPTPTPCRSP